MIPHSNVASRNAAASQTCIWPASTGPLFIRSVWMDRQGYRHFILNTDWTNGEVDSYKRHQQQQQLTNKTHNRPKQLLEPLKRPKLIPPDSRITNHSETTCSNSVEQLRNRNSSNHPNSTRPNKKLCKQLLSTNSKGNTVGLLKRHFKVPVGKDTSVREIQPTNNLETLPTEFYVDPEENYQLTERVLQWLDLAGKAPLSNGAQDNNCELAFHKTAKRVLTANPSVNCAINSSRRVPLTPLKRTESIHHLSLTLNEDDLVNHSVAKQSNIFHLSLLTSRKFRQMSSSKINKMNQNSGGNKTGAIMSPKSTTSSSGPSSGGGGNVAGASQNKPPTKSSSSGNKKKSLGKLGKTDSIENQYRNMIHRQLLETSCNTLQAKRQLHIFMPMPPSSTLSSSNPNNAAANQSQNDCDSCLNSLISDGSKAA